METSNNQTETVLTFVEPKNICLSKDKQYLLIFLPDGRVVRKHVNLFKAAMKLDFAKKAKPQTEAAAN